MKWYSLKKEEVIKNLESSQKGLTELDAKERLEKYGQNEIKDYKKNKKIKVLLQQFNSLLIYILLASTVVSFLIGHTIDAIVILTIVILNATIGFIQEYKAEEIIEKLKQSLKYKVLVIRDKSQKEIDPELLVPGDIVILEQGDKILADCRIIESEDLETSEAALIGESFPIRKNQKSLKPETVLADRKNMLYAGTSIVKGKATAMVVETGSNTEFGQLAELVQETKNEKMPLERKMDSFSKKISIGILIFVSIIFVMGIITGIDKIQMMLVSISLAIGTIPEGLPAIIAITLAFAVKQMQKENTLIRKLPAAETLGRTTVICTDKTGTLTQEQLTVEKIFSKKIMSLNSIKKLDANLKQLFKIAILCNNARDEEDNILGDPTEVALIRAAKKFKMDKKELTEKNPRVKEFAFTSTKKMMSIVRNEGKIKTSYVKGASQFIIERSTKEYVNGRIKLLTPERKQELIEKSEKFESMGLRTLGFAFRQLTKIAETEAENHLIFVGLVGMIDPPRTEVRKAIKEAMEAGIEIKIITGDAALTTKTIASKLGLKGKAIEGRELDNLPNEKWDEIVKGHTIFARVTPQQKLKVVEVLKKQKQIVGVTGDGVNDILALKKADIGISMGVRGSDVARDSSDMVLLDDNFASIVKAIKQGRRVFDNLKKSVKFLLSVNVANLFIIMLALVFRWPLPFLPLALLWMNLITDSLPALALSVEKAEANIMKRKPHDYGLLKKTWPDILVAGLVNFVTIIIIFHLMNNMYGLDVARTIALSASIFQAIFIAFSFKSDKLVLRKDIFNNKWLIYAGLFSIGLQFVAIYTILGPVLGIVKLNLDQLLWSFGVAFTGLILVEIWKLTKKKLKI